MLASLLYYYRFGQMQFLLPFLVLLGMYLAWRLAVVTGEVHLFKNERLRPQLQQLRYPLLVISIALLLLFGLIGLGVERVNFSPQARADLALNSARLMQVDQTLFGTYVPLWLHSSANPWRALLHFASPAIVLTYQSLSLLIAGALLVLALVNPRLCAHFFLMFCICLLLSIPAWYVYPVLSPFETYVAPPITPTPSSLAQAELAAYQPDAVIADYLAELAADQQSYPGDFLPVTTLPSMHIAWATGLLVYGTLAWPPLLIILLPYFLLNALATVYTLQHYAIDIPAGILIGTLAIMIVWWLKPERWSAVQVVITLVRNDLRATGHFIRRLLQYTRP